MAQTSSSPPTSPRRRRAKSNKTKKNQDEIAEKKLHDTLKSTKKKCNVIPTGFAGSGPNGSFFEAPAHVDQSKKPGSTSLAKVVEGFTFYEFLFGRGLNPISFIYSPNLVWLAISLLNYFYINPYNFDTVSLTNFDWIYKRLLTNTLIVFGYAGFWHVTLYIMNWSKRPFNNNRGEYNYQKVMHNMLYSFLGVFQATIWESIMMYCYATNRITYLSDNDIWKNKYNMFIFLSSCLWVPFYRECHFYFAHRFIHIRALYKYVHSLHHRNTDIEPFAGLSMHPVEHLYYFTSSAPSLFIYTTPFAFQWNIMHLLISPAASHSGWEDNMQSDLYHYLHHRYFECNYGTQGMPMDKFFGTFRDKLKEKGTTYSGGSEEKVDEKSVRLHDAKANFSKTLPEFEFVIYMGLNLVIWGMLYCAVLDVNVYNGDNKWKDCPNTMACLISVGPIVIAQVMASLTDTGRRAKSILYPFHKDKIRDMAFHLVISTLMCVVPVYVMTHTLLSEPGHAFFY